MPLVVPPDLQGAVESMGTPEWVSVTGVWRQGRIDLESVSALSESPFKWPSVLNEPPRPRPSGDLLTIEEVKPLLRMQETKELVASGAVLQLAPTRFPDTDEVALVAAAADVDQVETVLRPHFGDTLCVVASPWSADSVSSAAEGLTRYEAIVHGRGQGMDAQGRVRVTASITRVTDDFARWAAEVPDGLLDLKVWLTPLAHDS